MLNEPSTAANNSPGFNDSTLRMLWWRSMLAWLAAWHPASFAWVHHFSCALLACRCMAATAPLKASYWERSTGRVHKSATSTAQCSTDSVLLHVKRESIPESGHEHGYVQKGSGISAARHAEENTVNACKNINFFTQHGVQVQTAKQPTKHMLPSIFAAAWSVAMTATPARTACGIHWWPGHGSGFCCCR